MPSIYAKGVAIMIAVLLIGTILAGCGGNPVSHQPIIDPDPDPIDLLKVLEDQGLIVRLKTEKPEYKQGEPICFWFSIKNQGTQTHTIELRPYNGEQGSLTYRGNIAYYGTDMTRFDPVFQVESTVMPKCEIVPGAEVRFIEIVWDQKLQWTTSLGQQGTQVPPGFYILFIDLYNVYIDGHVISDKKTTSGICKDNIIKIVE